MQLMFSDECGWGVFSREDATLEVGVSPHPSVRQLVRPTRHRVLAFCGSCIYRVPVVVCMLWLL